MRYQPPAPLTDDTIDKLFSMLTLRYGNQFLDRWRDLDLTVVKEDWARQLAGFKPSQFRFALDNLPERPPTVIDFRKLALQTPTQTPTAALESNDDGMRGPTPAERDMLRRLAEDIRRGEFFMKPSRRWAYDLIAAHEAGRREQWDAGRPVWRDWHATATSLEMAREAIGTDPDRDSSQWDRQGHRVTPERYA